MKATKPFNERSVVGDVAFFDVGGGIVARVTIKPDHFATEDVISADSDMPEQLYSDDEREAFERGEREFVGVTVELERDGWTKSRFQGLWGIEVDWREDNSPHLNEAAADVVSWAIDETL
jgi:hypothetical protein